MISYTTYAGTPPEDFGVGRRCEGEFDGTRCTWIVSRYTAPQFYGTQGGQGPLLCSRCVKSFDPVAFRKGTSRAKQSRTRNAPPSKAGIKLPKLRAYRRGAGKTQEWLDTAIDAYPGYVGKVEREIYTASEERVKRLAEVLGVSVEELSQ